MSSVLDALKKAERDRRNAMATPIAACVSQQTPSYLQPTDWRRIGWVLFILLNGTLAGWLLIQADQMPAQHTLASEGHSIVSESQKAQHDGIDGRVIEVGNDVGLAASGGDMESEFKGQQPSGLSTVNIELPRVSGEKSMPFDVSTQPLGESKPGENIQAQGADLTVSELPPPIEYYSGDDFASTKLAAHIYSDTPSRRMIMLNGEAFREGDVLENGWQLVTIGREELHIARAGQRYGLPLNSLR